MVSPIRWKVVVRLNHGKMIECRGARAVPSNLVKLDLLLHAWIVAQSDWALVLAIAKMSLGYLEIKVGSVKLIKHASSVVEVESLSDFCVNRCSLHTSLNDPAAAMLSRTTCQVAIQLVGALSFKFENADVHSSIYSLCRLHVPQASFRQWWSWDASPCLAWNPGRYYVQRHNLKDPCKCKQAFLLMCALACLLQPVLSLAGSPHE
jgi:hypothetical protein